MNSDDKIYVAGHRGLVGSAIVRALLTQGFTHLVYRTHAELDLTNQQAVRQFFADQKPDHVILAAARVGGIHANNHYRGDFIYQNLAIETHVIDAAYRQGVKHLVFLGSSCIYPRDCPQPMREEHLLTGPLESTNEPYAIAKIAGIKLCEAYNAQHGTHFVTLMPTNLYGSHDNFDLETSHVIPALMRKVHEAKIAGAGEVVVWGSGAPRREFLHVDDLAEAVVFTLGKEESLELLNVGSGQEVTIAELAEALCRVVGFSGRIKFDPSKPDGTPRKLLDSGRIRKLGWHAKIGLKEGLHETYRWFSKYAITT
ncbi:MAG TPA: GDP-L-fucose synthase [Acidiferrobacteraceae bacterium]|nr:GDP-L-fucose synthase [Acidiferrobacteraceae bacterium]